TPAQEIMRNFCLRSSNNARLWVSTISLRRFKARSMPGWPGNKTAFRLPPRQCTDEGAYPNRNANPPSGWSDWLKQFVQQHQPLLSVLAFLPQRIDQPLCHDMEVGVRVALDLFKKVAIGLFYDLNPILSPDAAGSMQSPGQRSGQTGNRISITSEVCSLNQTLVDITGAQVEQGHYHRHGFDACALWQVVDAPVELGTAPPVQQLDVEPFGKVT